MYWCDGVAVKMVVLVWVVGDMVDTSEVEITKEANCKVAKVYSVCVVAKAERNLLGKYNLDCLSSWNEF